VFVDEESLLDADATWPATLLKMTNEPAGP
jgi:hypothetical protein